MSELFNSCTLCKVSNLQFSFWIMSEKDLFDFLVKHGVLRDQASCSTCSRVLNVDHKSSIVRCRLTNVVQSRKIKCAFKKSVHKETFFTSRLSRSQIAQVVLHWLTRDPPRQTFIINEVGVQSEAVVNWSSFCREVTIAWCTDNSATQIGGPGVIVELDEAKFGKRKYNRGRVLEGQWVFGALERENPRNIFLVPVPQRDTNTLLAIIKERIRPGSIIMSDCWRAYDCLQHEGYVHQAVNHSMNFVDPDTGAHTQNIERAWREVRAKIPRYGRSEAHFIGYLSEYMFKRAYPVHTERLHHFFKAAGKLYPPP